MKLLPNSLWLYLGGEDGFNMVHRLVDIDTKRDPKMPWISAWTLPHENRSNDDEPGWTWYGPLNLFEKSFRPIGPVEETGV